ncbi:hypothetical protein FAGKG844_10129 [Frankia sp. AgKG'84/4]
MRGRRDVQFPARRPSRPPRRAAGPAVPLRRLGHRVHRPRRQQPPPARRDPAAARRADAGPAGVPVRVRRLGTRPRRRRRRRRTVPPGFPFFDRLPTGPGLDHPGQGRPPTHRTEDLERGHHDGGGDRAGRRRLPAPARHPARRPGRRHGPRRAAVRRGRPRPSPVAAPPPPRPTGPGPRLRRPPTRPPARGRCHDHPRGPPSPRGESDDSIGLSSTSPGLGPGHAWTMHPPRRPLPGLFVPLFLEGRDDVALDERLAAAGVLVHPLSWYRRRLGPPGLVLGHAAHRPDRVRQAAGKIFDVVDRDRGGAAPGPRRARHRRPAAGPGRSERLPRRVVALDHPTPVSFARDLGC